MPNTKAQQNQPLPKVDFFVPASDLYSHDEPGLGRVNYRQAGPVIYAERVDYQNPPQDLPDYLAETFRRCAAQEVPAVLLICESVNGRARPLHYYLTPASTQIPTHSKI